MNPTYADTTDFSSTNPSDAPTVFTLTPSEVLRQLITQELAKPAPSFALVELYTKSLKHVLMAEAKKRPGGPSLQSADGFIEANGVTGTIYTGVVAGYNAEDQTDEGDAMENPYIGRSIKKSGSNEDQMLAALGDIAQRSGPDPLAAILSNMETVERLYGNSSDERHNLRNDVRAMIDKRLCRQAKPTAVKTAGPQTTPSGPPAGFLEQFARE